MDEQDIPISVDRLSGKAARQVDKSGGLESLLLGDADNIQSVKQIAEQEVRVVNNRKPGRLGPFLVLALSTILLFGVGYYLLGYMPEPHSSVTQQSHYVSPKYPVPVRAKVEDRAVAAVIDEKKSSAQVKKEAPAVIPPVDQEVPLFTVTVGPFINTVETQQAVSRLQELGLKPQKTPGRGQVSMVRLLEGVYPAEEARGHLKVLKRVVDSAFLLPDGDHLAVYAGSFHQKNRARNMRDSLADKKINVTLVNSKIILDGTMLTALQADQQTAHEVAAHLSSLGLQTQVIAKK